MIVQWIRNKGPFSIDMIVFHNNFSENILLSRPMNWRSTHSFFQLPSSILIWSEMHSSNSFIVYKTKDKCNYINDLKKKVIDNWFIFILFWLIYYVLIITFTYFSFIFLIKRISFHVQSKLLELHCWFRIWWCIFLW